MVFLLLKNGILKHADFASECRKSRFKMFLGRMSPDPSTGPPPPAAPFRRTPFPKYKNLDSRHRVLIYSKLHEKNHLLTMQFNFSFLHSCIFNCLHCLRFVDVVSTNRHAEILQNIELHILLISLLSLKRMIRANQLIIDFNRIFLELFSLIICFFLLFFFQSLWKWCRNKCWYLNDMDILWRRINLPRSSSNHIWPTYCCLRAYIYILDLQRVKIE